MTETATHIVHTITHGRVRLDIEAREGKDGIFYSTRPFRWYKKGESFEKAYSFATSARGNDLEDLVRATAEANNWIQLRLAGATAA